MNMTVKAADTLFPFKILRNSYHESRRIERKYESCGTRHIEPIQNRRSSEIDCHNSCGLGSVVARKKEHFASLLCVWRLGYDALCSEWLIVLCAVGSSNVVVM